MWSNAHKAIWKEKGNANMIQNQALAQVQAQERADL